jgi:hypothetical protein
MTELFPIERISQRDAILAAQLDEIESDMHEVERRFDDDWFDQFGYYPGDWWEAFKKNAWTTATVILVVGFAVICAVIVQKHGALT